MKKIHLCYLCHGSFRSNYDLNKHRAAVHEKLKSYTCDICDFQSAMSCNIKRHMVVIHKLRPYTCNLCDYKSAQAGNVRRHLNTMHNVKRKVRNISLREKTVVKKTTKKPSIYNIWSAVCERFIYERLAVTSQQWVYGEVDAYGGLWSEQEENMLQDITSASATKRENVGDGVKRCESPLTGFRRQLRF